MVQRFRKALANGDEKTAKNLLGSFEQLVQSTESASERLTRQLNDWVSFLVLPLFALANAGVTFSGEIARDFVTSRVAWGIMLGLVVGKPLGVLGFCKLAVRWRFAQLPNGLTWRQIGAVGMLAGIGSQFQSLSARWPLTATCIWRRLKPPCLPPPSLRACWATWPCGSAKWLSNWKRLLPLMNLCSGQNQLGRDTILFWMA